MTAIAGESRVAGLALLNAEVTRQAAAISYLNDFRLMAFIVLSAAPLLLLIRGKKPEKDLSALEDDFATALE
jgi:DHA2 family multidrug resistance protein